MKNQKNHVLVTKGGTGNTCLVESEGKECYLYHLELRDLGKGS